MNPLVSVIITNYNYANFVGDAINSVINQSYPNIEIIVVDDGSQDDSIEVISEFKNRIRLIKKENGGVSSARNLGMDYAQGELLAFLDADDYWHEEKIQKQVEKFQSTKYQLIYCKMNALDINGHSEVSDENYEGNFKEYFTSNPGRTPFPPSSVLISRELALKTGKWNITLRNAAEDFDFFRRCSKYSSFGIVDEVLYVHREHANSLTAGPLKNYLKYNVLALLMMYSDSEFKVNLMRERLYMIGFFWSFIKASIKSRALRQTLFLIIAAILPKFALKAIWSK